ncbi:MAG: glycosyltransferase family 2 protein, partial [Burkholderiales bacterium]|nr:glycosyltransferase family 2 protein [Burkholderiales bacterium]
MALNSEFLPMASTARPADQCETVSAVLITKNSERTIGLCLDSLKWASEIIVLDNGSVDQTRSIAESKGAKFHVAEWHGFGPQKNLALNLAQSKWILSIDSDEVVTSELASEIVNLVQSQPKDTIFEISRVLIYCGRMMRHTVIFPEYVPRLFRKGVAHFSTSLVHEKLLFEGKASRLTGRLMHDSFNS